MIHISMYGIPTDPRFVQIVSHHYWKLLLCLFEEFFENFEDEFIVDREDILNDNDVKQKFEEWIEAELGPFRCSVDLTKQFLALYCLVRSPHIFDLSEYPRIKNIEESVAAISASDTITTRIVGRRITPEEDRKYLISSYYKYHQDHKKITFSKSDFKKLMETVLWLDRILCLLTKEPSDYKNITEEKSVILPIRWWDPADDYADYNLS